MCTLYLLLKMTWFTACASRVLFLQPARLAWCHGKLYVANAYATGDGARGIHEFIFDSNYEVLEKRLVMETPQPFPPSNEKMAWSILGLACDPRDDDRTFKLYFTLSPLYSQVCILCFNFPTILEPLWWFVVLGLNRLTTLLVNSQKTATNFPFRTCSAPAR